MELIKQSHSLPLSGRGSGFHFPYGCVAKYIILYHSFMCKSR